MTPERARSAKAAPIAWAATVRAISSGTTSVGLPRSVASSGKYSSKAKNPGSRAATSTAPRTGTECRASRSPLRSMPTYPWVRVDLARVGAGRLSATAACATQVATLAQPTSAKPPSGSSTAASRVAARLRTKLPARPRAMIRW